MSETLETLEEEGLPESKRLARTPKQETTKSDSYVTNLEDERR